MDSKISDELVTIAKMIAAQALIARRAALRAKENGNTEAAFVLDQVTIALDRQSDGILPSLSKSLKQFSL